MGGCYLITQLFPSHIMHCKAQVQYSNLLRCALQWTSGQVEVFGLFNNV